jgi:hypothetical protein
MGSEDSSHDDAFSRHNMPELCIDIVPRKTEGAGNAGRSTAPAILVG